MSEDATNRRVVRACGPERSSGTVEGERFVVRGYHDTVEQARPSIFRDVEYPGFWER